MFAFLFGRTRKRFEDRASKRFLERVTHAVKLYGVYTKNQPVSPPNAFADGMQAMFDLLCQANDGEITVYDRSLSLEPVIEILRNRLGPGFGR